LRGARAFCIVPKLLVMTRVGLQLGAHHVRAVVLAGWPRGRVQAVEVPFDPEHPDEAIANLGALLGTPKRIAVAVDLQLLRTKRVTLPALPAAERRNIVQLEPERFFAVRGEEIVPAVRAEDGLVFAVAAPALARWVEAIERIAPVDLVEPTPFALARALAAARVTDAVVLFDGQDAGIGIAEIRDSRVTNARRVFGTVPQVAAALAADGFPDAGVTSVYLDPWSDERRDILASICPGAPLELLPGIGRATRNGVPGAFAAAYGAALGGEHPPPVAETLVSRAHGGAIRRRRIRSLGGAVAACAAALIFAVTSLDNRRDREVENLTAATAALAARAAPALAMQTELQSLARRASAVREIEAERPDPLRALRALSASLPPGAFARQVRGSGADWQADGYAPNASAVLSALGTGPGFHDVHFLAATDRAQIANQQYESFALAFRYAPAP
jgi:Tfp pilus assembly protein PilN